MEIIKIKDWSVATGDDLDHEALRVRGFRSYGSFYIRRGEFKVTFENVGQLLQEVYSNIVVERHKRYLEDESKFNEFNRAVSAMYLVIKLSSKDQLVVNRRYPEKSQAWFYISDHGKIERHLRMCFEPLE